MFHLYREAVLAREREEDERWRQRMLDKFAEDDRIGTTVHAVPVHMQYSRSTFAALVQNRAGSFGQPYSTKPAQRSSHSGQPCYIGWTMF